MLRKKKILIVILCLLLVLIPFFSFFLIYYLNSVNTTQSFLPSVKNTTKFEWEKSWEDSVSVESSGFVMDDSGNLFITGSIDLVDLVDLSFNTDVFVGKYDSDGNLLWNTTWDGLSLIHI